MFELGVGLAVLAWTGTKMGGAIEPGAGGDVVAGLAGARNGGGGGIDAVAALCWSGKPIQISSERIGRTGRPRALASLLKSASCRMIEE